jgi:pyruvate/2-oxoglutarate dehydrogenase complex dihydrolipoamide acyltransferase (E2) component
MKEYKIHKFPKTRIATFDVGSIGKKKHHISVILECDVTESRNKIRELKNQNKEISFTAWLLKAISTSIKNHEKVAGFLFTKRKIITFDDVKISIVVEKELDKSKVPIPLVIEKTDKKDIPTITKEIEDAKSVRFSKKDIVLNESPKRFESLYYLLPG